jgi:hypothetical protein
MCGDDLFIRVVNYGNSYVAYIPLRVAVACPTVVEEGLLFYIIIVSTTRGYYHKQARGWLYMLACRHSLADRPSCVTLPLLHVQQVPCQLSMYPATVPRTPPLFSKVYRSATNVFCKRAIGHCCLQLAILFDLVSASILITYWAVRDDDEMTSAEFITVIRFVLRDMLRQDASDHSFMQAGNCKYSGEDALLHTYHSFCIIV